jgi:hypothetical protein
MAPFELVKVPGAQVADAWQELRSREGVAPVLLGGRESASEILQGLHDSDGTGASALRGLSLDLAAWMAQRVAGRPDYYQAPGINAPWNGKARPIMGFVPAHDHAGVPYAEVFFALVPVGEAWRVPVYLGGSGWNECPEAAVHLAFFKRWFERYGAVVTTMADAVIELHVERPPATLEEAQVLAYEQFVYCPHIVYEGLGTLGNVAGVLVNRPRWYFWWA